MSPSNAFLPSLSGLILALGLGGCSSAPVHVDDQRKTLTDDLRAQDARIANLQDEIRHQRSLLAASPGDSSIALRLRKLIDQEDQAQALRLDIKISADEKARQETDASRNYFGMKDPKPGHQAPR